MKRNLGMLAVPVGVVGIVLLLVVPVPAVRAAMISRSQSAPSMT